MSNLPPLSSLSHPELPAEKPARDLPVVRRSSNYPSEEVLGAKLALDVQDLHFNMKTRERVQKYHQPYESSQGTKMDIITQCRSVVVNYMSEVGMSFDLANLTIHMAVALMDRTLAEVDIAKSMLQLVAISCILIAAKLEEREDLVPSISDLNQCTDNTYNSNLIKQMEWLVLNRCKWDLCILTPLHFLGLYLKDTLSPHEYSIDYPIGEAYERVYNEVASFAEFFIDMCRQDIDFLKYLPSQIAASSVVAARKVVKVSPMWSKRLEQTTGFLIEDIIPCCEHLWRVFETNFVLPGSPRSFS